MSSVNSVNRLVPGLVEKLSPELASKQSQGSDSKAEFGKIFSNMISSVNEMQHRAGDVQQALLNGEPVELHDVMIKAEEAGLAMDLLMEIRNKLISGYNEIMRMPM